MEHDFTLASYNRLCSAILNVQEDCRFVHYRENGCENRIILRHDVDRKPHNALRMAKLEHQLGLCSTYYFRCVPSSFDENIILQISDMGHEIGYHYEVMSTAKGDVEQAIKLFQENLKKLRSLCEIRTACMHGSPISKNNNINFWDHASLSDFGLVGEAYFDIEGSYHYCTDTGGQWNGKHNVRDKINSCTMPSLRGTHSIMNHISFGSCVYINCHPERWADSNMEIPLYKMKDYAINIVKRAFH